MLKVTLVVLTLTVAVSARLAGKLPGGFRIAPGFSCQGREYGFYADVENKCRAYHVCEPVFDDAGQLVEMAHYSFLCGQKTVFNQEQLGCSHPDEAIPCADSPSLYESSNLKFLLPPETEENLPLETVLQ